MNWLAIVPYLLAYALGAAASWPLARAPLQTTVADLRMENADLRTTNAESARKAALASAARLQAAQDKGDVLTRQLAASAARNDQLAKEKALEIKAATLGRACLSERTLGVLNGAPGITVASAPGGVPTPTGSAAAADEAASPHPGGELVSTDTDVGIWITQAGQQYDACRQRLDALIDWHEQPSTSAEAAIDR